MPPEKTVMGTRMHVDTDPPTERRGTEPDRRQAAPKPASPPHADDGDAAGRPPYSRKESPPGGIRLEGRGWRVTMPAAALVAVVTAVGGWFTSRAVSKGESAEVADVLSEVRELRKDVKGLRRAVDDVREEQTEARANDKKILNYAEGTFAPIVASLRQLGVKLTYLGNDDPARDLDFHPAPLPGSGAPPIQPRAALPERPSL
jgi:hypothetical protein